MGIERRQFMAAAAATGLWPSLACAQSVAMTFDASEGKVRTRATLNGVEMQTILDSGADRHLIDAMSAAAINLAVTSDRAPLLGFGGRVRAQLSQPALITTAGRSLPPTRLAIADLSTSHIDPKGPVDLILGAPLFHVWPADFDFVESLFTLNRRGFEPKDRLAVELTPREGWMTAPVRLPGGTVQAVVDTGSDAPLILSPAAARRLGLLREGGVVTAVMGGIGEKTVGRITSVERVTFGEVTFNDVPVQIAARDLGAEANIGLGLLSRFHLWLDFGLRRMHLTPNGLAPPFERNLVGFYGSTTGAAIRIDHVVASSPAETAGLKAGDVITAIDGEPAALANPRLKGAEPGRRLVLTLQEGLTRSLTLARYY